MRFIGRDVHRDHYEVAIAEGGEVRSAGRIETRPQQLELFAQSLGADDQVASSRRSGRRRSRGSSSRTWLVWWWPTPAGCGRSRGQRQDRPARSPHSGPVARLGLPRRGVEPGRRHPGTAPARGPPGAAAARPHALEERGTRGAGAQPLPPPTGRGPLRPPWPSVARRCGSARGRAALGVGLPAPDRLPRRRGDRAPPSGHCARRRSGG